MSDTLHESVIDGDCRTVAGDLAPTERHRPLAVERRRIAIEVLEGRHSALELDALAAEIADREAASAGSPADETTVAVELHHNHLPRLADHGIVRYDPAARVVHPNGATVDESDDPYYE